MANKMASGNNILLVLTDQQRDHGSFDSPGMASFVRRHLIHQNRLAKSGIRFTQHRITSSACVPSRACLFTGLSPWVHGVTQTDGFAKLNTDPDLTWLDAERHLTLGHRFQQAGYLTPYFGKWHLSRANVAGGEKPLSAADHDGWARLKSIYHAAQPLNAYGFTHWVGPEPHGPDPLNAGLNRDEVYVQQASAWLRAYAAGSREQPFLMVLSLVNPHDIVFWPAWSLWRRKALGLEGIPKIGPSPSADEDLSNGPRVLQDYRHHYGTAYGPRGIIKWLYGRSPETYRQFYCGLLKQADKQLGDIVQSLSEVGLSETTHVVFTSDHGELLGAHGGLHQKWYNAFEETLRVPLIVSSPDLDAGQCRYDASSHLDIVPTLLGLVGLDLDVETSCQLPGRNLFDGSPERPSYFVTHDRILQGEHQVGVVGRRFPLVRYLWPLQYFGLEERRTSVEALVMKTEGQTGTHERWKLIRYFAPESIDTAVHDQWSLFELESDPNELHDLSDDPGRQATLVTMQSVLLETRESLGGTGRHIEGPG